MSRLVNLAIVVGSAALLAGMMLTNPDYNSVVRPFVTKVSAGDMGETRMFAGRFDTWRTADRVSFDNLGTSVTRDTEGVFLIVDLELSGTIRSTMVDTIWEGASKRRYASTKRVANVPRQVDQLWLQPGLSSTTFTVFELPLDEIEGGRLVVTMSYNPDLDGTLSLAPPDTPPPHEAEVRLGR